MKRRVIFIRKRLFTILLKARRFTSRLLNDVTLRKSVGSPSTHGRPTNRPDNDPIGQIRRLDKCKKSTSSTRGVRFAKVDSKREKRHFGQIVCPFSIILYVYRSLSGCRRNRIESVIHHER